MDGFKIRMWLWWLLAEYSFSTAIYNYIPTVFYFNKTKKKLFLCVQEFYKSIKNLFSFQDQWNKMKAADISA